MTGWRMRPAASTLGVVAIVFVMITATASEADKGTTEPITNHHGVDDEDRRDQGEDSVANQTIVDDLSTVATVPRANETANEVPVTKDSQLINTTHENLSGVSQMDEGGVVQLQGDQSDLLTVPPSTNNIREPVRDPVTSEAKLWEHGNPSSKMQHSSGDFSASTRPSRSELASSIDASLPRSPASWGQAKPDENPVDDEGLSNVVDQVDDPASQFNQDKSHGEETIVFTTASFHETIAAEARSLEQKNVEDIRAISFQVPATAEEADESDKHQRRNEESKNAGDSRKDHSRPANNLLLGGGKSTKAFYEIKPSIKTEMEGEAQIWSSTQKPLPGRKFVLPSVDSAFGKFGPYFEDGDQEINITARIGSTMLLDCKIGMLGDKQVTWLQQHSMESFRLLTVGRIPYSVDERIRLNFRYPSNWRLQILYVNPRDSGLYKCQVATHPPLVKTINVVVTAPGLTITDDSGRVVPKERHLKAGSALKLRCEARDVMESLKESVVWTRGDETLTEDVSENRTMEVLAGKEVLVIVSTLIVEKAIPRHAGNYSCVVPGKVKTTIAVHVLNGELPAAVHDGNGVSRAFLNLWLIHLTMSYVFSR